MLTARAATRLLSLGFMALAGLLAGCATVRVDSEVSAFSRLPPTAPVPDGSYRFDPLPSQQADAARNARIEADTQAALAQVGLKRDDAAARYAVQVQVRSAQLTRGGWDDGFWRRPYGWGPYGAWRYGHPFYGPPGFPASPQYQHEVQLVLRDLQTQQVVFESKAVHEGLWAQTDKLLPALLTAALRDFPHPPGGVRRVEVDIPNR